MRTFKYRWSSALGTSLACHVVALGLITGFMLLFPASPVNKGPIEVDLVTMSGGGGGGGGGNGGETPQEEKLPEIKEAKATPTAPPPVKTEPDPEAENDVHEVAPGAIRGYLLCRRHQFRGQHFRGERLFRHRWWYRRWERYREWSRRWQWGRPWLRFRFRRWEWLRLWQRKWRRRRSWRWRHHGTAAFEQSGACLSGILPQSEYFRNDGRRSHYFERWQRLERMGRFLFRERAPLTAPLSMLSTAGSSSLPNRMAWRSPVIHRYRSHSI